MFLMLQNTEVLYFNLDEFVVQVIRNDLLPFSLRHAFTDGRDIKSIMNNVSLLREYLSSRVLSMSRDNIKQICALYKIPQLDSTENRIKLCLFCNGVSISDSYWVRADGSSKTFEDVNLRANKFGSIVEASLYGIYPSATISKPSPELTTHGVFRKAWVRKDNKLYLLKSDRTTNNINTRMEVLASDILECFHNRIDTVRYTGRVRNTSTGKHYVDKCENFVTAGVSFVEAWEVMEYCKRISLSYTDFLGYDEKASSIALIDFLLVNTDRHTQNYGFMMDNVTGRLVSLAPLFDFNHALVADLMGVDAVNTISQMFNDGRTLLQLADHYRSSSSLSIDRDKLKHLRSSRKEYKVVFDNLLKRCDYLGI